MMQGDFPFFDSPEDALKAIVQVLGGAKAVAKRLWPTKDIDRARGDLLDRLNPNRSEKFALDEVMAIFRMGSEAGYHASFQWFANDVGYEAKAITHQEQVDRVADVVEQASSTLATAMATLERLKRAQR